MNLSKNNHFVIIILLGIIILGISLLKENDGHVINDDKLTGSKTTELDKISTFSVSSTIDNFDTREIVGGGPVKDGIPSIDNPVFVDESETIISDESAGIGIVIDSVARFYPYNILVWHEIVNDSINDTNFVVSYCPLCATGIVYNRTLDQTELEFGVSGLLWQSNLLMYDRQDDPLDESLWSQIKGQAVTGPMAGVKLEIIPSTITTWKNWKTNYPESTILAIPRNFNRSYDVDPYGNYYADHTQIMFIDEPIDNRLPVKEFVLGVEVNPNEHIAIPLTDIPTGTSYVNEFKLKITRDLDEINIKNDQGEELFSISGFWFAWVVTHPDTLLVKPTP